MAPSVEFEEFDQTNLIESNINVFKQNHDQIEKILNHKIKSIDHTTCEAGEEDAFFIADFSKLQNAIDFWYKKLPQVTPHYAVKCNNDIQVIKYLAAKGINFDCASKNEIEFILNLGISADRIVYANPCKNNSYIRYANSNNINLTTVDNTDELYKLARYHPNCDILIRIATDDSNAQCQLSTKFGCTIDAAINELLPLSKQLNLNVKGVAFHVGSGAKDVDPIFVAIRDSKMIFDKAIEMGFSPSVLDIGGGFEQETFETSSSMVNYSLNKFFPNDFVDLHKVKFIAEPGRFMVSDVFTLATHVIAKRELPNNSNNIKAMIYINDGVYGNLNCILFDHQHPTPKLLEIDTLNNQGGIELDNDTYEKGEYYYSVWGPTCDGLDCVADKVQFNKPVTVGDWIYFPNIGAYTSVASTSFNGFNNENEVIYINV